MTPSSELYTTACRVLDELRDQALEGEVDAVDLLATVAADLALACKTALDRIEGLAVGLPTADLLRAALVRAGAGTSEVYQAKEG